jgi:hypothetical protein
MAGGVETLLQVADGFAGGSEPEDVVRHR